MAEHATNALDPNELFKHVQDSDELHVWRKLAPSTNGEIKLPQPFKQDPPIFSMHTGNALLDNTIQPWRVGSDGSVTNGLA